MKKAALIAALALLAAGCVTTGPRPPFIIEGTENAVSVN